MRKLVLLVKEKKGRGEALVEIRRHGQLEVVFLYRRFKPDFPGGWLRDEDDAITADVCLAGQEVALPALLFTQEFLRRSAFCFD